MSSWAKPGVKCVCIKQGKWRTVRRGYSSGGDPKYKEVCVVEEFPDEEGFVKFVGYEHVFSVTNFRPIITKTQEQDVTLFKSILTDIDVSERV